MLIDTQVLLWFTEGDGRLGSQAQRLVSDQWQAERLAISAMTVWEIGMLLEKGRVSLSMPLTSYVQRLVEREKLKLVPVDAAVAVEAGQLPDGLPGDPGDRLIVATARISRAALVTADRQILGYAAAGHLRAIDARL